MHKKWTLQLKISSVNVTRSIVGTNLRIWSHLMKKSSVENFIFCAVIKVFWNEGLWPDDEHIAKYRPPIYCEFFPKGSKFEVIFTKTVTKMLLLVNQLHVKGVSSRSLQSNYLVSKSSWLLKLSYLFSESYMATNSYYLCGNLRRQKLKWVIRTVWKEIFLLSVSIFHM